MNDQIYFVLILIFIIIILSRFIVRLYRLENAKAKSAIYYFRMLLGFLIAMLIYTIVGMIRGQDIIGNFFGR